MFKVILIVFVTFSLAECYFWKPWSSDKSGFPCDRPVQGGNEGRYALYVIKASHGGAVLPGKFVPDLRKAYVSTGGREYEIKNFEIICESPADELIWENDAHSGRRMVSAGHSGQDTLFPCRFKYNDKLVCGKLHGRCYVPYGGKKRSSKNWETLKEKYI